MRRLALVFVVVAAVVSFCAVFVPFSPGPQVTQWFTDNSGSFPVIAPVGVLFLMITAPVMLVFIIINLVRSRQTVRQNALLDQPSVVIHRDRALYGAVYAMDVIVNGKKTGSVMSGKSLQLALPQGEHELQVEVMGKATEPISIEISETTANEFNVGFKKREAKQDIYILPVSH